MHWIEGVDRIDRPERVVEMVQATDKRCMLLVCMKGDYG